MSNLRIPEPHEYAGHLPDDFAGEVLGICEIAWSGWENDFAALLVRDPNGTKSLVRLGGTSIVPGRTEDILVDRVVEYERLIRTTKEFLEEFAKPSERHMTLDERIRRYEEHAARKKSGNDDE